MDDEVKKNMRVANRRFALSIWANLIVEEYGYSGEDIFNKMFARDLDAIVEGLKLAVEQIQQLKKSTTISKKMVN